MFKTKNTAITLLATLGFVSLVGALLFFGVLIAIAAFIGPAQPPPGGTGAIGLDASNNMSIGASSPAADTKFLIVPAAGNTFGLRVMKSDGTSPLLIVKGTGQVGVATGTSPLGIPEELTVQGDLYVSGNVSGGTFSGGGFTGSVSAANVSAGHFGSAVGGGTYSFPGLVGIATSSPVYRLDINGALRLYPTSTVPTSGAGAMYYDSGSNSFQCYQGSPGAWRACGGGAATYSD